MHHVPFVATRTLFFHISLLQQVLFYALSLVALGVLVWGIYRRYKIWKQGQPVPKIADWIPRIRIFLQQALEHRRIVRRKYAGALHLGIFYGMLVLFIGTCIVAIEHWGELVFGPHWFYKGWFYLVCKIFLDIAGVLLIIGVLMALGRRYFAKPVSVGNAPIDLPFLLLLLFAGISGFLLEGSRLVLVHPPISVTRFEPVGALVSSLMPGMTVASYEIVWWIHAFIVLGVIAILPYGRWLHLFTIPPTIIGQPDRAMGVLANISMEQVEQTERMGYANSGDLTRWELMSLDACMECGRCTDACPANKVGKELNPKQIVLDLRRMAQSNSGLTTDVISDESLWACTNCHACVRECPALIRHVDLLDGIRRFRVAEGRLAGSAAKTLRQLGSRENPWGLPSSQRLDWANGLDVQKAAVDDGREVLMWVGCAGAFDPRTQKITRAFAELMTQAGVNFTVLGPKERCTGDPARRIGDDFLYQELAQKNIETLNSINAKIVVTQCPHCFHTIKNEYPQLGGNFEVLHHTQLLQRLVDEGRLTLPGNFADSVTYHDPCFLGRVNAETEAPRKLLRGTMQLPLAEPERRESKTFCCGAGGGRMWMEEPPTQRPGVERAKELIATGAKTVATGCPFCKIMIGDSVAQVGGEDAPAVMDISEVMIASLENRSGTNAASDVAGELPE